MSAVFAVLSNKDFYLIENFPNIFHSSKRYVLFPDFNVQFPSAAILGVKNVRVEQVETC
jgi:hypothetical protein